MLEDEASSRFLDPNFRDAVVTDGQEIILNVGQIYTNADELLERHLLDPSTDLRLLDLFGTTEAAAAFLRPGFGDDLARYIARTSATLCRQWFAAHYGDVNWEFLEHAEPRFPENRLTGDETALARLIVRDAFDPKRTAAAHYGVADLTYQGQLALFLAEFAFFMQIGQGFRAAPEK